MLPSCCELWATHRKVTHFNDTCNTIIESNYFVSPQSYSLFAGRLLVYPNIVSHIRKAILVIK